MLNFIATSRLFSTIRVIPEYTRQVFKFNKLSKRSMPRLSIFGLLSHVKSRRILADCATIAKTWRICGNIYERCGRGIYIASHRDDASSKRRARRLLDERRETPAFIDIFVQRVYPFCSLVPIGREQPHSVTDKTAITAHYSRQRREILLHRGAVYRSVRAKTGLDSSHGEFRCIMVHGAIAGFSYFLPRRALFARTMTPM